MTGVPPLVSVVIAARPEAAELAALKAARALDYPADRLEILVARGRQPSVQRNLAVHQAEGEWVYFLDDDSIPSPSNLCRASARMADPKVAGIGGPAVCPALAPLRERTFAATMANGLAFGPSAARYYPRGQARPTGEKELILCNLMLRRSTFLNAGGFNENLYPNEENALMDQIQAGGGLLIYDPEFVVERRPRPTVPAFLRMLRTYGRGRAEQFRLHPTWGSTLNFIPPLFCLYLIAVPFWPKLLLWPLLLYGIAVLAAALGGFRSFRVNPCALASLIFLSHLCYGLGFWAGLTTRLRGKSRRQPVEVTIEHIAPG